MRLIVTGVPGVGKTTIIKKLSEKINYSVVIYGTVMLEIAKKYGVQDRDKIRKQSIALQHMIQKQAAEHIVSYENIIIDTHMSIKTPSGYLPGLPEWVLKVLKPDMLVLIEASPEEIVGRRLRDSKRHRDASGIKEIKEHQSINRCYAAACSIQTGANLVFIHNQENGVELAVNKLVEMIQHA